MVFGEFESLNLKKEIFQLNTKGFFIKCYFFNAKILYHEKKKAIFIVKKKIGNSPTRNKIKRQIRAILASLSHLTHKNMHMMIIVKQEILNAQFLKLKTEFAYLFTQINRKTI